MKKELQDLVKNIDSRLPNGMTIEYEYRLDFDPESQDREFLITFQYNYSKSLTLNELKSNSLLLTELSAYMNRVGTDYFNNAD